MSNTDLYAAGGKTFSIADGSEIFILADKWYDNPETYTRSVTSADALDALNISTGSKTGTNSEIIAADVDKSGSVTAMDAYSILQYAANSTTNMAEFRPEWFYIDDLATLKASTVGATTLDPTSFEFDYEVDQFVGTTDTINVTGVLLGDVTGSYSYLEPNVDPLNGLRSLNINDVNPNAGTTSSSGSGSGSGSGSWTPQTTLDFDGSADKSLTDGTKELVKVSTAGLDNLSGAEPKKITGFNATEDKIQVPMTLVATGTTSKFEYFNGSFIETDASDLTAFKTEVSTATGNYFTTNAVNNTSDPGVRVVIFEIKDDDNNSTYATAPDYVLAFEGTDADSNVDGYLFLDSISNFSDFRTDDLMIETSTTSGVTQQNSGGPTTVTVQGTTPVVAADAEEVFNLPSTPGTSETIKFSSLTSADKDVINNFGAGEDKVQVVSTATGVEAGSASPLTAASMNEIPTAVGAAAQAIAL